MFGACGAEGSVAVALRCFRLESAGEDAGGESWKPESPLPGCATVLTKRFSVAGANDGEVAGASFVRGALLMPRIARERAGGIGPPGEIGDTESSLADGISSVGDACIAVTLMLTGLRMSEEAAGLADGSDAFVPVAGARPGMRGC